MDVKVQGSRIKDQGSKVKDQWERDLENVLVQVL
jgi:hypothetical protein